jgi:hypothetical protein
MRWLPVEAGQGAAQYDSELRRKYQRLKFRRSAPAESLGWGVSCRDLIVVANCVAVPTGSLGLVRQRAKRHTQIVRPQHNRQDTLPESQV